MQKRHKKKLEDLIFRLAYIFKNWRQIVHLLLATAHFGVNNRNLSPDFSLFGKSGLAKFGGIPGRIRMMRARAFMGFIPLKDAVRLFPGYAVRHGYLKGEEENGS